MESMVAMIVCLLVAGYGWHMRSRQRQVISGWKQTKGRVVETGIREEMRTPVGGAPGKWPRKTSSLAVTFFIATMRFPASTSKTRSTKRNGYR